jgi:tape measure domain-containing protein
VAFNAYDAKFQITAGVVGTDAIDRFNTKLNTVGKTADNVNRQMASLTTGINALAGAFGIQQLVSITAELARATIQIEAFQKQLSIGFGTASTFELEKLRGTMRELGISQELALGSAVRFTSALKLSGQSMAEANRNFEAASKLILSNKLTAEGAQRVYYAMSQTASKGKLTMEELGNQLGDTLAGFTQQTADAMGVTLPQLFKLMEDGKVSADDFFMALRKIGDGIDADTLDSAAQSLGKVQNAMFDLKASVFDSRQIKTVLDGMASGLAFLSENLSTIIEVAKMVGIVLGVRFLTSLRGTGAALALLRLELASTAAYFTAFGARAGIAAAASINLARALGVAGAAARGALAFIGGPLGAALILVASAFMQASASASNAEARLYENAEAAKVLGIELSDASQKALEAADEQRGLGTAADSARPAIWSFQESIGGLTQSQYDLAVATREASTEMMRQQMIAAQKRITEARGETAAGRMETLSSSREALFNADFSRAFSLGWQHDMSLLGDLASGYRQSREANRDIADAQRTYDAAKARYDEMVANPISQRDLPPVRGGAANDNEAGGGRARRARTPRERAAPTEVQIAKSYEDMRDSIAQDTLRARADLSQSATERAQLERMALASDLQQRLADIAAARNLSDVQKAQLVVDVAGLEVAQQALIAARERASIANDAAIVAQDGVEATLEQLRFEQGMATSIAERTRISRAILAAEIELERLKLQQIRDNETLSAAEREQATRALARLPERQARGERQIAIDNRSQLDQYAEEVKNQIENLDEALDNVRLTGIKSLEEGLASILTGTKSVAAGFRDMALSIINDLMQIAIRSAIIKPIMTALGIGSFAKGGAFDGGIQMFANGGVVTRPTLFPMARGGVGMMGEAGPEAIMPLKRGPSGRLGVEATGAGGGGSQNVTVNVSVEGGGSPQMQGDTGKASELGKAVANAVRAELLQQKRPGGLLAA